MVVGSSFFVICYCHWQSLVLRNGNRMTSFLHSGEVMTQEEPLYMTSCSISILTLIKNPKADFTDVTQTWFSDDYCALGTFSRVKLYYNSLKQSSLGQGNYPKSSKSVLIVHPEILNTKTNWIASWV